MQSIDKSSQMVKNKHSLRTLLYRSAGIRLSMIGSIVVVSPNHASGMNRAQIT